MRYISPEYEAAARQAALRTKPEDRPEAVTILRTANGHYSGKTKPQDTKEK